MPSGKKNKKASKDSSKKPLARDRSKSPSRSNSESQTASRSNSESQTGKKESSKKPLARERSKSREPSASGRAQPASRSNSESQTASRSNSESQTDSWNTLSPTDVASRSNKSKPTKQTTPAGALGVVTPPATIDGHLGVGARTKTTYYWGPEHDLPTPDGTPKSRGKGKEKQPRKLNTVPDGQDGKSSGPPAHDGTQNTSKEGSGSGPPTIEEVKPDFSKYHKDEENTDTWWNDELPKEKKKDSLITVIDDKIQTIGTGTFGTVFINGKLNKNTDVAVRRVLIDVRSKIARAPLKALVVGTGKGDNVLNLLGWKTDPGFVYFAHEKCIFSIEQLYKEGRPDDEQCMTYGEFRISKKTIAKNTIDGVCYLCDLPGKPVFKHLKPSKVLVYQNDKRQLSCKVSDFGLSYQQVEDQVTSHRQATNENVGWMAPELLKIKYDLPDEHTADDAAIRKYLKDPRDRNRHQRMNDKKLITYSLGLFIFYIFNDGEHYWKKELKLRELNMIENNTKLRSDTANSINREFFEVNEWVGQAVRYKKDKRPEPKDLKIYTFFWNTNEKIDLLRKVCKDWNTNNIIKTSWADKFNGRFKDLYSHDKLTEILKDKDLKAIKRRDNIFNFLEDINDYFIEKKDKENAMDQIESRFPGIFAMIYIVTAKVLSDNAQVQSGMRQHFTGWNWNDPIEDVKKLKEEKPFQTVKKQ